MKIKSTKKILAVLLSALIVMSSLVCGTIVSAGAATYSVGDTIVYKYMVKCNNLIQAFEGKVMYPADKLKVATEQVYNEEEDKYEEITCGITVYDGETGSIQGNVAEPGVIKFNASEKTEEYDFRNSAAMVTVEFEVVNPAVTESEISASVEHFYNNDQHLTNKNSAFNYVSSANDTVIEGGSIDLDNQTETTDTLPSILPGIAPVLYSDIVVQFGASNIEAPKVSNPRLVFTYSDNESTDTVTEYTKSGSMYLFKCSNVSVIRLKTVVTAKLYAEYDGVTRCFGEYSDSLADYCVRQMSKSSTNQSLKTLLADLLNYGSTVQVYASVNPEDLANNVMTSEMAAYATSATPALSSENYVRAYQTGSVTWLGAQEYLRETISGYLYFNLGSVNSSDVKIEVKGTGINKTYTAADFKTGAYGTYIKHDFTASQLRVPVEATVYVNNVKDAVMKFSVEGHSAYILSSLSDQALVNVYNSMFKYGDAASAFLSGN